MSNDPFPSEQPDPYAADPYSSDPYVPGNEQRPPAHEAGRTAPLPTSLPPASLPPGSMPSASMPPGPGPAPFAYPPAPHSELNVSAIVLVVLSGLALVSGYCCLVGLPGLVLGILGIVKQPTDPEGAARLTKIGWITFGVMAIVPLVALAIILAQIITQS